MHTPCPRCTYSHTIKSGKVHDGQRRKCKRCGYQFTRTTPRGRPVWQKSLAVFLHSNGMSMHALARMLKVKPGTISKWVHAYAKESPSSSGTAQSIEVMRLDDMEIAAKTQGKALGKLLIAINSGDITDDIGVSITL